MALTFSGTVSEEQPPPPPDENGLSNSALRAFSGELRLYSKFASLDRRVNVRLRRWKRSQSATSCVT